MDMTPVTDMQDYLLESPRKESETPPVSTSTVSTSSSKSFLAVIQAHGRASGKGKDGSSRGRRVSRLRRGSDVSPGSNMSPRRSKSPHSRFSKLFNESSYHSLPPFSTPGEAGEEELKEETKKSQSKKDKGGKKEDAAPTKKKRSSSLTEILRIKRKKRQDQEEEEQPKEDKGEDTPHEFSTSSLSQELAAADANSRWPSHPRPTSQRSLTVDSPRTHRRMSHEEGSEDIPRPRRSTSPHPRPRGDSISPRIGRRKRMSDVSANASEQQNLDLSSRGGRRATDSFRRDKKLDSSIRSERSERKGGSERSERKLNTSIRGERKQMDSSNRSERKLDSSIRSERKMNVSNRGDKKLDSSIRGERKSEKKSQSEKNEKKTDSAKKSKKKSTSQRSERKLDSALRSEKKSDTSKGERKDTSLKSEGKSERKKGSRKKSSTKKKKDDGTDVEKKPKKPSSMRKPRSLRRDMKSENGDNTTGSDRKARSLSPDIHYEVDEKVDKEENADDVVEHPASPDTLADTRTKSEEIPPVTNDTSSNSRRVRSESPPGKGKRLNHQEDGEISKSAHPDAGVVEDDQGRPASPEIKKKRYLKKKLADTLEMVSFLSQPGRKSKADDISKSPGKQKKEAKKFKNSWNLKGRLKKTQNPEKGSEGNAANASAASEDLKTTSPQSTRSLEEESQGSKSIEEYNKSTVGIFVSPGRKGNGKDSPGRRGKVTTEEFTSSTVGVFVSPGRNSMKVNSSPRPKKSSISLPGNSDSRPMERKGQGIWTMPLDYAEAAVPPQMPIRQESSDVHGGILPETGKSGLLKGKKQGIWTMPTNSAVTAVPPQKPIRRGSSDVDTTELDADMLEGGTPPPPPPRSKDKKRVVAVTDDEAPTNGSNEESQDSWGQEGAIGSLHSTDTQSTAGKRTSKRSTRSLASVTSDSNPDDYNSIFSMDSTTGTPVIGNQRKQLFDSAKGDGAASVPPPCVASSGKEHSEKATPSSRESASSPDEPCVQANTTSPEVLQKIKSKPRGRPATTGTPVRSKSTPPVTSSTNPTFSAKDGKDGNKGLRRENSSQALPAPPIRQGSFDDSTKNDKEPEMPSRRMSSGDAESDEFTLESIGVQYMESVKEDEAVSHPRGRVHSLDDVLEDLASMVDSTSQSVCSGSFAASYGSMTLGGGESLSSDDTFRNRTLSKKAGRSASPDSKIMVYRNRRVGTGSILKQPDEPAAKPDRSRKYSMVSLAPQPTISLTDYVGRINDGQQTDSSYSRRSRSHSPRTHFKRL
eukprot:scaffold233_cov81-Cylindrotheca_fusiformis.AAC.5